MNEIPIADASTVRRSSWLPFQVISSLVGDTKQAMNDTSDWLPSHVEITSKPV